MGCGSSKPVKQPIESPNKEKEESVEESNITEGLMTGIDAAGLMLYVFDINTLSGSTFNISTQKLPREMTIINTKNNVYMMGGRNVSGLSSINVEWSPITGKFANLRDLTSAKYKMGVTYYADEYFYVIGGRGQYQSLSNCDRYDIITGEWTELPELNEPKYSSGITLVDNSYIYVFGGLTYDSLGAHESFINEYSLKTIEKLDLKGGGKNWVIIPIDSEIWLPVYSTGVFQLSISQIMVCGGMTKKDNTPAITSIEPFVYNIGEKNMENSGIIPASTFTGNFKYHKQWTGAFSEDYDLLLFHIESNKWTLFDTTVWPIKDLASIKLGNIPQKMNN